MNGETWPETVCAPAGDSRSLDVPIRYKDWVVCTDGSALVAIPDDGREAGPVPSKLGQLGEIVDDAVSPREDAPRYDITDVREWAGPVVESCPACGGDPGDPCGECDDGYVECECFECGDEHWAVCPDCEGDNYVCSTCDGEGKVGPRSGCVAWGQIGEVFVDRRLFALVLDGCPGSRIAIETTGEMSPVHIGGEGWSGLVMPVRRHDGAPDPAHIPDPVEMATP